MDIDVIIERHEQKIKTLERDMSAMSNLPTNLNIQTNIWQSTNKRLMQWTHCRNSACSRL